MLQAVIFDMDGLMVDTERLHHESFAAVLRQFGIQPKPNKQGVIHISGVSAEANWERFKRQYRFECDNAELSKRKNDIHLEWLRNEVKAMPGLKQLLRDLQAEGYQMAIASSSIREHIDIITKKLGITSFFNAIVSGQEVKHGKPAPDIFLRASKKLGVLPARCAVLEDASKGIQGAKAAGMFAVAVPNEFTATEHFEMADARLGSLSEVVRLLKATKV